MSEEDLENNPDLNPIGDVADDALRFFRLNIFIIAVYSSTVGLLLQNDANGIDSVVNSPYTLVGLLFWMGTTTSTILTYRAARKYSTAGLHENTEQIIEWYSPRVIVRNMAAIAFGVLLTVFALLFGFLDGTSSGDLPVWLATVIVMLGVGLIAGTLGWLVIMEKAAGVAETSVGKARSGMYYARSYLKKYREKREW